MFTIQIRVSKIIDGETVNGSLHFACDKQGQRYCITVSDHALVRSLRKITLEKFTQSVWEALKEERTVTLASFLGVPTWEAINDVVGSYTSGSADITMFPMFPPYTKDN